MSNPVKRRVSNPRTFRVGIVGASVEAMNAFSRIFSVTNFRNRIYEAVPLMTNSRKLPDNLDFVILCTLNPTVLAAWDRGMIEGAAASRPQVRLARRGSSAEGQNQSGYFLESPVNPSRLIKLLDTYTIKELNYLPEFEIGGENTRLSEDAVAGLKLLNRPEAIAAARREGLNKALVVDDSLAVRRQLEIEFGLLGVEVTSLDTAEAALGAALGCKFDIIFMDVVLPNMDGYTACRRIKKIQANKGTPIILLTSKSSSFDRIKGALAGCDTYLVKPINHSDFERIINDQFPQPKE
ncbi:MAG: response regulator [Moraxellaceae bacterium]|jgi:two-component system, cell cycle response regulator|nr:MAG: response regulator [Moraxellaceae bacterium]